MSRPLAPSPAAILVAAGSGDRAGGAPKQFRRLGDRSLLEWCYGLLRDGGCYPIVVVLPPDLLDVASALGEGHEGPILVAGGASRQKSVHNGLRQVTAPAVVVHDGARPFASPGLVRRVVAALEDYDAAVAAVPLDETLKRAEDGRVTETVDRSALWRVQTPQAFKTPSLVAAHARAVAEGFSATDDAQLIERYGGTVGVVAGTRSNMKLTYPEDFEVAEAIARVASGGAGLGLRVGLGFDAHAFEQGRRLVLGGVHIANHPGLAGHSDADLVAHAVADAVLGAAGLGDIGAFFPPESRYKDAPSVVLLKEAAAAALSAGYSIVNVDVTVMAETPRLSRFRGAMIANIADALAVETTCVSIKSTTTDGLGFTGRSEGIAAHAVALLQAK